MTSPDTNNNIGNESNDENDDDEQEDEPVFKFSTITISPELRNTENLRNLAAEFSCIAVHEKFLIIGKTNGEISIIDHMGHAIPNFQIKAHTYPVNAISIDDSGEFIGSCCQEGRVRDNRCF